MSKLEKYIEEALENIRNDREVTRELLDDAMKYLAKDESRHRDIGLTLSKYVETLQRSNEQLVKVASLVSKSESSDSISQKEMEDIYNAIQSSEDKKDE
tara:strand:- start:189 stop:485 length:297 start_codon:yes stop_codon:yes gene_type:complete